MINRGRTRRPWRTHKDEIEEREGERIGTQPKISFILTVGTIWEIFPKQVDLFVLCKLSFFLSLPLPSSLLLSLVVVPRNGS